MLMESETYKGAAADAVLETPAAEAVVREAEVSVEKPPLFKLEDMREIDPFPEELPDPADCLVFNGGDSTVEQLLSGDTQPVMLFRREVWDEVQYLIGLTPNTEMAMFLLLKPWNGDSPKHVACDLFFPMQKVSSVGVVIDAPSVGAFYDELSKHDMFKTDMHRRICHLHSHAGMETTWSCVDDAQQLSRDDLGYYDMYRYYCVVNVHGDVRCSFVQYRPFKRRFDGIPVVVVGKSEGLSDERKAVLDGWVKDRAGVLTESVFQSIAPIDVTKVSEEYKPYVAPKRKTWGGYSYDGAAAVNPSGCWGWEWNGDDWWNDPKYDASELGGPKVYGFHPESAKPRWPKKSSELPPHSTAEYEETARNLVGYWLECGEAPRFLRRKTVGAFMNDLHHMALSEKEAGRAAAALYSVLSGKGPQDRLSVLSGVLDMFGRDERELMDGVTVPVVAAEAAGAVRWLVRNAKMLGILDGYLGYGDVR